MGCVGVHMLGHDSWQRLEVDPQRCVLITSRSRTAGEVQASVARLPEGLVTQHIQVLHSLSCSALPSVRAAVVRLPLWLARCSVRS